jgi:hypothetical protein
MTCRELVGTADINLPVSLMNIMWSLLDEFRAADATQSTVSFMKNRYGI